jgi:hypothetical protein
MGVLQHDVDQNLKAQPVTRPDRAAAKIKIEANQAQGRSLVMHTVEKMNDNENRCQELNT